MALDCKNIRQVAAYYDAILDLAEANMPAYAHLNPVCQKKRTFGPHIFPETLVTYIAGSSSAVFVGASNERRRRLLEKYAEICDVSIVPRGTYGDALRDYLGETTHVVNIHFEDGTMTEAPRFLKAYLFGKPVATESVASPLLNGQHCLTLCEPPDDFRLEQVFAAFRDEIAHKHRFLDFLRAVTENLRQHDPSKAIYANRFGSADWLHGSVTEFGMREIIITMIFAFTGGAAQAATLTFDTLKQSVSELWAESGFTGYGGSWDTPGAGTIHGNGGPMADSAAIYRDAPFTPISIEMVGHGGLNRDGDLNFIDPIPYDNLRYSGFRDGALVASVALQTGVDTRYFTHFFSPAFRMIDHLEIETPDALPGPGGAFCDDCTAISYDNMTYTLAPVPLPATAALLIGGILGLGAVRNRCRSRTEATLRPM